MLSGQSVLKDKSGRYFIDADGEIFYHILEYLRKATLPPLSMSVQVYGLARRLRLQGLMKFLNGFLPVVQMQNMEKVRSLYPKYENIFSKIQRKIETRNVHDKILSINIPIYSAYQMCCSCCKDEGIESGVSPEGSGCTALIDLTASDLKKRGFEFEIGQTACKNTISALLIITVGPCSHAQKHFEIKFDSIQAWLHIETALLVTTHHLLLANNEMFFFFFFIYIYGYFKGLLLKTMTFKGHLSVMYVNCMVIFIPQWKIRTRLTTEFRVLEIFVIISNLPDSVQSHLSESFRKL